MTRQHVSQYKPPADPYAYARCVNCPHFVNAGEQQSGRRCQYSIEGCQCTDHKLREVDGNGPEAA